ncbi:MAG: Mu transposase C-terminal domain-containing protein [Candidatus Cloacimonetes bacterium]|nr:Mu transposase C-terminal domain-containing protein [Candidatus Cloacimonadota bacterium]MCF7814605.1 Mu transposase C-terminal domain-containing protein [Candidatus Cloacimonadota bacterium]MCF7869085.1 Mu transposase C-terminal domain-containing protein [Candidatus Cloacimonadota bacterium]MCF7884502.1 Mu transposase C-terminal domain-containing protein [Candidatus Cloacimonadota bacterium]
MKNNTSINRHQVCHELSGTRRINIHMNEEKMIWKSTKEAAEIRGISSRGIRKAAYDGRLQSKIFESPGGRKTMLVKIPESEIEKWKDKNSNREPEELSKISKSKQIKDFEKEIPDRYIRIGQQRAQLCNWILEKKKEGVLPIGEIFELAQQEYQLGEGFQELRQITEKKTISVRQLQRLVSKYEKSGNDFMALIPQYCSNSELKRKISANERCWLNKQLFGPNKIKIGSAIKYIKHLAREGKIESPSSESTLRRAACDFIQQYPNVYHLARYGEESLKNKRVKSILRDWDKLKVGDLLVADGHRLNFNITDPFTGKPKRMLLIVFEDMKSRYIVGASIAPNEDTANISSALRMAILNLGSAPKYIYLDNGKAFGAKYFKDKNLESELGGLYDRLGCKVIFAEPYNAKAKPVERFFRTFSDDFERRMDSFIGSSVQDKPVQYKRSEPWMRKHYGTDALTMEEAIQMMNNYFQKYYAKQPHQALAGKTPREIFISQKPNLTITKDELDYLMLSVANRVVGRQGIQFDKKLYWSKELVNHVGENVTIRYDFNDLSFAKVYLKNRYICNAKRREYQSPLMITEADREKLNSERYEITHIVEETKASTEIILDKAKDINDLPQITVQKSCLPIIENLNCKPPWEIQGISCKEKFLIFIDNFGQPFTLTEAAKILGIKYETLKKIAQPLYDKKIVKNGIRNGSALIERIDQPINAEKKDQTEIDFDILPLNTIAVNCHEECQSAGTDNNASTYWK